MIITSFVWFCCLSFGKTLTDESVNCQVATGYSSMDIFLKTYYKCWESSNSAQLMCFKLCEEYWQGIAKKISTSDAGMPLVQSRKINKKSSAACGVHRQRINNRGEQGLQQANDNETNDRSSEQQQTRHFINKHESATRQHDTEIFVRCYGEKYSFISVCVCVWPELYLYVLLLS